MNPPSSISAPGWWIGPDVWMPVPACPHIPLAQAARALLVRDPAPPSRAPALELVLGSRIRPEGAWITVNGQPFSRRPPDEQLPPLMEKWLGLAAMHNHRHHLILHAAWIRVEGVHLLLPADPRAGKSTLCTHLVRQGSGYGGDDLLFIHHESFELSGWAKRITLKQGSFGQVPDAPTWVDLVRGPIRYVPDTPGGLDPVSLDRVRAILLPQFVPEQPARIVPLSRELAALALVQQTVGGLDRSQRHLAVIHRLLQRPAFLIQYPDSPSAEQAIRQTLRERT